MIVPVGSVASLVKTPSVTVPRSIVNTGPSPVTVYAAVYEPTAGMVKVKYWVVLAENCSTVKLVPNVSALGDVIVFAVGERSTPCGSSLESVNVRGSLSGVGVTSGGASRF